MAKLQIVKIKAKDFLLVPNLLSLSRIFLAVPIYVLLREHNILWAFVFIFIAGITDLLDGYAARHRHEITELGKILDPIADKIIIGANVVVIVHQYGLPMWLGAIIIVRDVAIIIGSLFISSRLNTIKPSNFIGKITVNVIALTLVLYVFQVNTLAAIFSMISLFFIIISAFKYGLETIQLLREDKK